MPVSEVNDELSIIITGLPGSGKTRVIQSLQASLMALSESPKVACIENHDCLATDDLPKAYQIWCVIDVRSPFVLDRDDWLDIKLQAAVKQADGIVFSFLENASLEDQSWWNNWAKNHAQAVPIVRWLNQRFPNDWTGFGEDLRQNVHRNNKQVVLDKTLPQVSSDALQTFEFEVSRVCLDHLLFGLDSSKQNLGMKIVRVQGVVNTLEYENKVAIEGSALRWDMFAAEDEVVSGKIIIQGFDLEKSWLDELFKASLV